MTAPTLLDYADAAFTTGSPKTTDDLNWNANGDLVVVLGMTEDNGVTFTAGPTLTGVTLAALTGLPTNEPSSCKGYGWSGTASGDGNGSVSASLGTNGASTLAAWAFSGHGGAGTPVVDVGAGLTVSVTVAGPDSSVLMVLGDWNATADVTVTTVPAGGTVRRAQQAAGAATALIVEWANQAAGIRSYGVSAWTGTGTVTKAAVEVKGTAGGGPIVVNVGQAVETDTATTVGRRKTRSVGQANETDTATAVGRLKSRAVGQAVELDSAAAVGRLKIRAVGHAIELDTATPVARRKTRQVGQAVETDTAFPVTAPGVIVVPVGQAMEVDSAQPVGRLKVRVVGQAAETDTAGAVGRVKVRLVGQANEVDTAGVVTASGGAPTEPLTPDVTVDLAALTRTVDLGVAMAAVDLAIPVRVVSL